MTLSQISFFKEWFAGYTKSFYSQDPGEQQFISLKVDHTYEVCKNIVAIAREQSLGSHQVILAEAIGLFHDVGRFPQFAKYKTFKDSISVNHGKLGAEILGNLKILDDLGERERELILNSVKFHNTFTVPDLQDREVILFLKMIRDADKLDIWRVFLELAEAEGKSKESQAAHGLPDSPGYSEAVMETIRNGRTVSLSLLKSINDFRLMELSWVYDLNFRTSMRMLIERDYIPKIARSLPNTPEVNTITKLVDDFARRRLKSDSVLIKP